MAAAPILEPLLEQARKAALAGGLTRICRLHLQLGHAAPMTADAVAHSLEERFDGPLFDGCEVSIEATRGDRLLLASIEGVVAE